MCQRLQLKARPRAVTITTMAKNMGMTTGLPMRTIT